MCKITTNWGKNKKKSQKYFIIILLRLILLLLSMLFCPFSGCLLLRCYLIFLNICRWNCSSALMMLSTFLAGRMVINRE